MGDRRAKWLLLAFVFAAVGASAQQVEVDWRLRHNFPFFRTASAHQAYLASAAQAVAPGETVGTPLHRELSPEVFGSARLVARRADTDAIFHENRHEIEVTWSGGPVGNCQLFVSARDEERRTVPCASGRHVLQTMVGAVWNVQLITPDNVVLANVSDVVRDLTIVGMGDSYAAGEGNPDLPAHLDFLPLGRIGQGDLTYDAELREFGWTRRFFAVRSATWLDRQCHRSLYSHQVMAAAKLAALHPKLLVRFAHWSCSGAEIWDGVLHPQASPPGGGEAVGKAQINAVAEALCRKAVSVQALDVRGLTGRSRHKPPKDPHEAQDFIPLSRCVEQDFKVPDLVLLSIGGNDVGFASVVLDLLLPRGGKAPFMKARALMKPLLPAEAAAKYGMTWLAGRYSVLDRALREGLRGPAVLQVVYPSPLLRKAGFCQTHGSLGVDALAEALHANRAKGWNITAQESADATRHLIEPLQATIRANIRRGWAVADSHLPLFASQGFCSPDDERERLSEYQFPKFVPAQKRWEGMAPTDWKPYKRLARWVRMPNDSYLTQLNNCESHVCIIETENFHGTAHPNAFGQAALAQSALSEILSRGLQWPKR